MSPIKITYPEKSVDVQGPKQTLNVIKKKKIPKGHEETS